MRLVFLSDEGSWAGPTRVFATVAHALAARGHETTIAAPAGSDMWRVASQSRARPMALGEAPRRPGVGDYLAVLEEQGADTAFVHTDREHLLAAKALRKRGRGALVRRVGAGETLVESRMRRQAEKAWPTRYLYTTETPPSGHAAPSGTLSPARAELGVALPSEAARRAHDGYAVIACLATREAVRRATNVVRAVALMAQQHPGLRLRVFGTAAADPDLQVLASALGLARRVEWLTHRRQVAGALDGASAGWVIGDGDDAALGVLHLMAHGLVPLAERTSVAARYVTHGIHGVLMASLDPAAMAAETTVLLADPNRRATMGDAGRARVEREFMLRDMVAGFEAAARPTRERTAVRA